MGNQDLGEVGQLTKTNVTIVKTLNAMTAVNRSDLEPSPASIHVNTEIRATPPNAMNDTGSLACGKMC